MGTSIRSKRLRKNKAIKRDVNIVGEDERRVRVMKGEGKVAKKSIFHHIVNPLVEEVEEQVPVVAEQEIKPMETDAVVLDLTDKKKRDALVMSRNAFKKKYRLYKCKG